MNLSFLHFILSYFLSSLYVILLSVSESVGKKTDLYFISCRFRIFDYVPARDRFLRFLGFQSRACLQLFSIGRYLHSGGNDNIHSGQLVDKSYDLCYTNA